MGSKEGGQRIKTAYRLTDILDLLHESGPLTTTEVAERVGIAKSTAHTYLSSMLDLELVVRDPEGYSPSLKLLNYGMSRREQFSFVNRVNPWLKQLANDTNEGVYLAIEEHGMCVYVDYALGNRAAKSEQALPKIGSRWWLHSISAGKAILAHLPEDRVDQIIEERGLTARTDRTITSVEALSEELATIRERGYAISRQEGHDGVHSIAAPIVVSGTVLGAISIAGPAHRLTISLMEDETADAILASKHEIEHLLTAQRDGD